MTPRRCSGSRPAISPLRRFLPYAAGFLFLVGVLAVTLWFMTEPTSLCSEAANADECGEWLREAGAKNPDQVAPRESWLGLPAFPSVLLTAFVAVAIITAIAVVGERVDRAIGRGGKSTS